MIIYKTTNLINGKIYVGKDKHNNPKYLGSGKRLKDAIKCYGKENFKKEILEYCTSHEQMGEREKYWIKELDSIYTNGKGYNMTEGGDGGDTLSSHPNRDLIVEKISRWHADNKREFINIMKEYHKKNPVKEETKLKLSELNSGENNGMYNKHHTEETKQLQSEIRKEWHKNLSEDDRKLISRKISESNKGKDGYWKDKTNEKHSQWMKENNPMLGKTHTDKVRKRISEANSKPKTEEHKNNISKNSPNNKQCTIEGIVYRSIAEASRQLGLSENTVRGRIKNKNFKEWMIN